MYFDQHNYIRIFLKRLSAHRVGKTESDHDWKTKGELYGDVQKVELKRGVSNQIDMMQLDYFKKKIKIKEENIKEGGN